MYRLCDTTQSDQKLESFKVDTFWICPPVLFYESWTTTSIHPYLNMCSEYAGGPGWNRTCLRFILWNKSSRTWIFDRCLLVFQSLHFWAQRDNIDFTPDRGSPIASALVSRFSVTSFLVAPFEVHQVWCVCFVIPAWSGLPWQERCSIRTHPAAQFSLVYMTCELEFPGALCFHF